MVQYEEVTATASREPVYPYKAVFLPHLIKADPGSPEHLKWQQENWWMVDYHVMNVDKPRAVALALKLQDLFLKNEADQEIAKVVEELRALRSKDFCQFTPQERWWWGACQLNNYCGDINVWGTVMERLEKYEGRILEALSGHHSYFEESPRREFTALDGCRASLERYPYPAARRICCDVDQITKGSQFPFLEPNTFDVVSVSFGYKYPAEMLPLMRAFRRVLKPGGTLSFTESKTHGYPELEKRQFTPRKIADKLRRAGFREVCCAPIDGSGYGDSLIYHAEARK